MTPETDLPADLEEYVAENRDFLARVLARGGAEAQGYALAAIANGGSPEQIDAIQAELEEIKEGMSE